MVTLLVSIYSAWITVMAGVIMWDDDMYLQMLEESEREAA